MNSTMHLLYVWPEVNNGPFQKKAPDKSHWNVLEKFRTFVNYYKVSNFWFITKRTWTNYMKWPVFPAKCIQFNSRKKSVVFWYSDSLAYFDISNQNYHHQTGYNCDVLTWIIINLLVRNKTRLHGNSYNMAIE